MYWSSPLGGMPEGKTALDERQQPKKTCACQGGDDDLSPNEIKRQRADTGLNPETHPNDGRSEKLSNNGPDQR